MPELQVSFGLDDAEVGGTRGQHHIHADTLIEGHKASPMGTGRPPTGVLASRAAG